MRTLLIGTATAAVLFYGAGALAQNVPPGTTEPVPPVPGTTVPGQMDNNRDAMSPSQPMPPPAATTQTTRPAIDRTSAQNLVGRTVVGADGKDLGEVKDVILNARNGNAEKLVIASGGFLGIGEKNIAVDVDDAEMLTGNRQVQVRNLTQAQVDQMAEYNYDKDTLSLTRSGKNNR